MCRENREDTSERFDKDSRSSFVRIKFKIPSGIWSKVTSLMQAPPSLSISSKGEAPPPPELLRDRFPISIANAGGDEDVEDDDAIVVVI